MFSIFKKKKQFFKNTVWLSNDAKMNALANTVRKLSNSETLIVFSSFPESIDSVREYCKDNGIEYHEMLSTTDYKAGKTLNVVALHRLLEHSLNKPYHRISIRFIALEHYPVQKQNEAIFDGILKYYPGTLPTVFVSFDDPVMQIFGSDRMKELMSKMGMDANESIEHNMIDSSITQALEKVDKSVSYETKTNSEAEWYAKNFK